MPNFLSWTVVAMIVSADVLRTQVGVREPNLERRSETNPSPSLVKPGYWPLFLVCLKIWHSGGLRFYRLLGGDLRGINPEIYESASMDGASRWEKIRYITLPLFEANDLSLLLTACNRRHILWRFWQCISPLSAKNSVLYPTTDVIDTYVYARAYWILGNVSMSSAVGVFQSIVGFLLVVTVNQIGTQIFA